MIKVLMYSHQVSLGGCEKNMQVFMKHLDKNKFDVWCAFRSDRDRRREPQIVEIIGKDKIITFTKENEFIDKIKDKNFDILHVFDAGFPCFPVTFEVKKNVKKILMGNVFGDPNHTGLIDFTTYQSNFIARRALYLQKFSDKIGNRPRPMSKYQVLYNPVQFPNHNDDFRKDLNLVNKFVVGSIKRPDDSSWWPIALNAYKEIETDSTCFLALPGSKAMKDHAKSINIKNIIYLDSFVDDYNISKFFNTIDVLAHFRLDGECNPNVFSEAFAHGKPIVSHVSYLFNGQIEIMGDAGFVVGDTKRAEYRNFGWPYEPLTENIGCDDYQSYAKALQFFQNKTMLQVYSRKAKNRALKEFAADSQTKKLEKIYQDILS